MEYAQAKLPNEIDLYKETTALDMKLDEYIQKFTPSRKRSLGEPMQAIIVTLIKYCCLAWRIPEKRLYYLRQYEAEYTVLEYLIRKSHKPSVKQLSDQEYLECAQIQAKIAKQLSCWIVKTRKGDDVEEDV